LVTATFALPVASAMDAKAKRKVVGEILAMLQSEAPQ
jgi:hypothetical protein